MANMKLLLKTILFTPGLKGRWGLPVIFAGKPGTGKTAQVEDGCRALGLHLETVIASLREPSDFNGLPIPVQHGEGTRVVSAPPHWAAVLADKGRGVCFMDEVNTCTPATQAALLRVILDGSVGDLALPPTVRFLAAMNPTEEAAGGWDLAPPLANRFGHWQWDAPDAGSWSDWLLGARGGGEQDSAELDPEKEEKRVLKAFDPPFAKARGMVAGFVRARPELLLKMPPASDPKASQAWPSPRSWEMATRAIAGTEVHGLDAEAGELLLSAFVGSGAASELDTYRRQLDLPDPADVLDARVTFVHSEKRLDRTVAVLSGCTALVTGSKVEKKEARVEALWELFAGVMGESADLVVPSVRVLVNAKLFQGYPSAKKVLSKMQPLLQQAGLGVDR